MDSEHPLASQGLERTFGGALRPYLQRIERDASGLAERFYPMRRLADALAPRVVVIDPEISFGRPTISGRGISIGIIVDRFSGGESMADLAEDYDLTMQQIEEAIRYGLPDELAT